jgi:hypothetical protein
MMPFLELYPNSNTVIGHLPEIFHERQESHTWLKALYDRLRCERHTGTAYLTI